MVSDKAIMLLKCKHLAMYAGHVSKLGDRREWVGCDTCDEMVEIIREATAQDLRDFRIGKAQGRLF